jgi:hypothetical protein
MYGGSFFCLSPYTCADTPPSHRPRKAMPAPAAHWRSRRRPLATSPARHTQLRRRRGAARPSRTRTALLPMSPSTIPVPFVEVHPGLYECASGWQIQVQMTPPLLAAPHVRLRPAPSGCMRCAAWGARRDLRYDEDVDTAIVDTANGWESAGKEIARIPGAASRSWR